MKQMSFAVTATPVGGNWQVKAFRDDFTTVTTSVKAVRSLRAESAAFALLCVDDEYFVIVRPAPDRVEAFISDITMAVDDDFAATVADAAGLDIPEIDPDELDDIDGWADGNFEILSDLGLSEEYLTILADDPDLWPHEAIERISEELGFDEELYDAAGYDAVEDGGQA